MWAALDEYHVGLCGVPGSDSKREEAKKAAVVDRSLSAGEAVACHATAMPNIEPSEIALIVFPYFLACL
jgi:hypothetical protein